MDPTTSTEPASDQPVVAPVASTSAGQTPVAGTAGGSGVPGSRSGEPDYRFLLANERTFLAYIRTALALDASAVVVHQLSDIARGQRVVLTVFCAALAVWVALIAFQRWSSCDRAIRADAPLPRPSAFRPLSVVLIGASAALGVVLAAT